MRCYSALSHDPLPLPPPPTIHNNTEGGPHRARSSDSCDRHASLNQTTLINEVQPIISCKSSRTTLCMKVAHLKQLLKTVLVVIHWVSKFLPFDTSVHLSYVESRLRYGTLLWNSSSKTNFL